MGESERSERFKEESEGLLRPRREKLYYDRIAPFQKDFLLDLIINHNKSIREAAKICQMNYGSAKTHFCRHQNKWNRRVPKEFLKNYTIHQFKKVSSYRELVQGEKSNLLLSCKIGGNFGSESCQFLPNESQSSSSESIS